MKCLNCGEEFTPLAINQFYCSASCGRKYRKTHDIKKLHPAVSFDCAYCGKRVVTEEGCKDKRTRFCSPECEKKFWRHKYIYANRDGHQRTNFHSAREYFNYEKRTNNV